MNTTRSRILVPFRAVVSILAVLALCLSSTTAFAETSVCDTDCLSEMLTFAYVANLSAGVDLGSNPLHNAEARITATTAKRIDCTLNAGVGTIGDGWKTVWGPVVVTKPDYQAFYGPNGNKIELATSDVPANTMFVARYKSTNNYVVAIAGTNARSNFDWMKEDFDAYPVSWIGLPMWRLIFATRGTMTGLGVLQGMTSTTDDGDYEGQDVSLYDFLKGVASSASASDKATIYVAGHSLGGALAPALALWLHDERDGDAHRHYPAWDPDNHTTLQVFSFAGASPGNKNFSDYMHTRFPGDPGAAQPTEDGMKIVQNTLDVVPHAFNMTTLKEIPDLYSAVNIKPGKEETTLINKVIAGVQKANNNGIHYATLGQGDQIHKVTGDLLKASKLRDTQNPPCLALPALVNAHADDFALEAYYQHVCAYPLQLQMPDLIEQIGVCKLLHPNG